MIMRLGVGVDVHHKEIHMMHRENKRQIRNLNRLYRAVLLIELLDRSQIWFTFLVGMKLLPQNKMFVVPVTSKSSNI